MSICADNIIWKNSCKESVFSSSSLSRKQPQHFQSKFPYENTPFKLEYLRKMCSSFFAVINGHFPILYFVQILRAILLFKDRNRFLH